MIITPYNQIDSTIATPSTKNLAYPLANLDDTYASQVFKFTGYTDENIVFDAGAGSTIDFDSIGIENHNFTSGATINIQGNATDSWGSPSFDETVTYRANTIYQYFNTTSSYRFARIRIQDAGNTTALQIGIISLGEYLSLPSINSSITIVESNNGIAYIGNSGQAGGASKWVGRSYSLRSDSISLSAMNVLRTIITTNGLYQPIFAQLYEDDYTNEQALYCVFDASNYSRDGQNYQCTFAVQEVF